MHFCCGGFTLPLVGLSCFLICIDLFIFLQGSHAGKMEGLCSTFNGPVTEKKVPALSASG